VEPIVTSIVFEVDHLLMRLVDVSRPLVARSARAASDVTEASSWTSFGYRNSEDFAREHLGRTGRWLRRMSALHREMCACPVLRRAVDGADGGPPLRRAAAFEISAVVTAANAKRWVERARHLPVRELRNLVSAERKKSRVKVDMGSSRYDPGSPSSISDETASNPDQQLHHPSAERLRTDVHFRLQAPPEMHVAFEEAMDLHSAVAGRNVGVRDFIESLVGEASSGGWSPSGSKLPPWVSPAPRDAAALRTRALDHVQIENRRAHLHQRSAGATATAQTTAMRRALETLALDAEVIVTQRCLGASSTAVATSHEVSGPDGGTVTKQPAGRDAARVGTLRALIALENEIEIRAADLLVDLSGYAAWKALGFAGLAEYAEERLGWGATNTYRRVRLARKMRRLPPVRSAYEAGRIGMEAATWVVRNAPAAASSTAASSTGALQEWLQHAVSTTVKRLRDEDRMLQREHLLWRGKVARHVTRSRAWQPVQSQANTPAQPSGRRCPAHEAQTPVTTPVTNRGSPVPADSAWRSFVGRAPGRSRHLILALGSQLVERVAVRGALAELPLGFVLPHDLAEDLWGCIESARLHLRERARTLGQESAAADARLAPCERIARDLWARDESIPHWVGLLALIEDCVRTWDVVDNRNRHSLDAIHNRDGWRCGAPACTSRRNLQTHHLKHRSQGGGDEPWNLQGVCAFHHLRGEHGGLARCRGRAPLDVVWRLGTTRLGTWYRNEKRIPPPAS
jgi:hypothetical protein